jgi:hypothetical protein
LSRDLFAWECFDLVCRFALSLAIAGIPAAFAFVADRLAGIALFIAGAGNELKRAEITGVLQAEPIATGLDSLLLNSLNRRRCSFQSFGQLWASFLSWQRRSRPCSGQLRAKFPTLQ